ncbi:MAG: S41 family peptidase [Proteobacteria bacterium]|nr:S41 family peptidase [Pseudomonadota bacterium]MDA0896988.1 S41 family peptidase [Pseudomonadota bacterium]MDA1245102.1 S41 family peptidase [Pseudomonadota bacterium]
MINHPFYRPAIRRSLLFAARYVSVSVASLLFALPTAAQESADTLPLPLNEVRMFTQALDHIRRAYVEEIDDETLLEYAIQGMLSGLDPHSAYMAGNEFESLQDTTTGQFGGLGVEVSRRDGYILVVAPIDGSPADRAGVLAGDLIIEIDNKPIREMQPEDAARMMRGEPGSQVSITIAREGEEPFDISLTREIIEISSVRSRMLEPGYAYLRISQFRGNTGEEFAKELQELLNEEDELKGLVLDLRNNPGGVLQASVSVVDAFIDSGDIVSTKGRLEDSRSSYSASMQTIAPETPLVVLINNGSASASEIVAGALQDHGRALIMGTDSFGKGSVQTVLPLAADKAIKLTTSLYYTPSGRSIQAQGIIPDIEVEEAFVTRRSRSVTQYKESDLAGHLENGNETGAVTSASGNANDNNAADAESKEGQSDLSAAELAQVLISAEEVLVNDYPLNEALNVLKGINAYKPLAEKRAVLVP